MMKETFRAAGEVQYAEIKKDAENKSRGFGIVRFTAPDEARRAVSILLYRLTLVQCNIQVGAFFNTCWGRRVEAETLLNV